MRICYLTDFFVPHYQGGGERRYYEIARRLVKKGHTVDIVCMRIKGARDTEKIHGITVNHLGPTITQPPRRTFTDFITFLRAQRAWLKKHDYDLIEAHGTSILILPWVKYVLKKPAIALIHDLSSGDHDQWFAFGNLGKIYECIITRVPVTKILTVGTGTKEQLVHDYNIPETKIRVITNGVDLKLIDSIKTNTHKKNTIIFIGRLIPHKHVDDLLNAFDIVRKNIPDAQLTIIGTGPQEQELKHQAKKLHLTHVTFLGTVPHYNDVIKDLKQSSVLALPSTREGFGLVLAEAHACALPVVAYDIDGVRDVVQSGVNGLLTKQRDVAAFAQALINLLTNNTARTEFGDAGRKHVEQLFTWDKTVYTLEKFYKAITHHG